MKKISATTFRANIYKLLDEVIETGKPFSIERKGKTIIVDLQEAAPVSIFDRLSPRVAVAEGVSDDDLIHHDLGLYDADKAMGEIKSDYIQPYPVSKVAEDPTKYDKK